MEYYIIYILMIVLLVCGILHSLITQYKPSEACKELVKLIERAEMDRFGILRVNDNIFLIYGTIFLTYKGITFGLFDSITIRRLLKEKEYEGTLKNMKILNRIVEAKKDKVL